MTINDIIAFKSILFNNYGVISSFQLSRYRKEGGEGVGVGKISTALLENTRLLGIR